MRGGKKEVRPWRGGGLSGGPEFSVGVGHVREVVAVVGGPNGGKHGEELPAGLEGGVHFLQSQAEGVDVLEAGNGKDAVETVFHALREVFNQAFKQGVGTEFGKGLHLLNAAREVIRRAGAATAYADFIPIAHGFEGNPTLGAEDIHHELIWQTAADLKDIQSFEAHHLFALEEVMKMVGETESLLKSRNEIGC